MSSILVKTDGREIKLKNLGWLLRHWSQVSKLAFHYEPINMTDGKLIAFLGRDNGDNDFYETDFACLSVLWNWLDRPIFRGVKFQLTNSDYTISKEYEIGNNEWKEINKLEYPFFLNRTTNKPIELISSCCGVESVKPMPGTILGECSKCKNLFNFHVKGLSEQKTFENLPLIS